MVYSRFLPESSTTYSPDMRRAWRKPCGVWKLLLLVALPIIFVVVFLYFRKKPGDPPIVDQALQKIEELKYGKEPPEVTTSRGTIRGKFCGEARCFLGIPFAKPPVGPLRFKHPVPPEKLDQVLETKFWKRACPDLFGGSTKSEDCLYLNVIAPLAEESSTERYPVLVYIHGGAYLFGSSYQNEKGLVQGFVSRKIIVVTISYRLGVFGFFTSENEEFPPNAGTADQVAALKWVREEIGSFQGDPSRVTIAGSSAGGFSASLLTLSPLARLYFQQAIMMSGTAFCPWAAYGNQHQYPRVSRDVAEATGCISARDWDQKQLQAFKTCIADLDTETIIQKAGEAVREAFPMPLTATSYGKNWAPRLDGPNGLLPGPSLEELSPLRKKGMPVMLGVSREENFHWTLRAPPEVFSPQGFNKTIQNYGSSQIWGRASQDVQEILYKRYKPDNGDWFWSIVQLTSDRDFNSGAVKEAEMLLETTPNVFAYSFDFPGFNTLPNPNTNEPMRGASHGGELSYLFQGKGREMADIQDELWTIYSNFIISGNPNKPKALPEVWRAFNRDEEPFYSIGSKPHSKTHYQGRANSVWNKEIETVYRAASKVS